MLSFFILLNNTQFHCTFNQTANHNVYTCKKKQLLQFNIKYLLINKSKLLLASIGKTAQL